MSREDRPKGAAASQAIEHYLTARGPWIISNMNRRIKGLIVAALLACVAAVLWAFRGPVADSGLVDNANVLGGLAGVTSLFVALLTLWPRGAPSDRAVDREGHYSATEIIRWRSALLARIAERRIEGRNSQAALMLQGKAPLETFYRSASWQWTGPDPMRLRVRGPKRSRQELSTAWSSSPFRVAILGEPGTGKTYTALSMLRMLNQAAVLDDTKSVTELFYLSDWFQCVKGDPKIGIRDWMVSQLATTYDRIPVAALAQLVDSRQIVPIFDGFDEAPAEYRSKCMKDICDYAGGVDGARPLVITSRVKEFSSEAAVAIFFEECFVALPITPEAILRIIGSDPEMGAALGREEVRKQLDASTRDISAMLGTPLRLWMLRRANIDAGTWRRLLDVPLTEGRQIIMESFVAEACDGFKGLAKSAVRGWLSRIAASLEVNGRRTFKLDDLFWILDPDSTVEGQRRTRTEVWRAWRTAGTSILLGCLAALFIGLGPGVVAGLVSAAIMAVDISSYVNSPALAGLREARQSGGAPLWSPFVASVVFASAIVVLGAESLAGAVILGLAAPWVLLFGLLILAGALSVVDQIKNMFRNRAPLARDAGTSYTHFIDEPNLTWKESLVMGSAVLIFMEIVSTAIVVAVWVCLTSSHASAYEVAGVIGVAAGVATLLVGLDVRVSRFALAWSSHRRGLFWRRPSEFVEWSWKNAGVLRRVGDEWEFVHAEIRTHLAQSFRPAPTEPPLPIDHTMAMLRAGRLSGNVDGPHGTS
ncbi:hypothetical protein [Micromonospora sp. CPCC 205558]|uniref:hypothetical protein n=1 Tax=Micromonospora sp. CPCC 205558 TaxID=3122403 RepID=UPI002FEFE732